MNERTIVLHDFFNAPDGGGEGGHDLGGVLSFRVVYR